METLKEKIQNTTQTNNLKSTSARSTMMAETKPDKQNTHMTRRPKTECPTEDKKKGDKDRININFCTMSLPIDQAFNNIIQLAEATKNKTSPPKQPPIDVDKGMTQVESSGSSSSGSSLDYKPTPEVVLMQALVQNPTTLNMAMAFFEYQHTQEMNQLPPTSPTNSRTTSLTTTDNLHPGYPYRKHSDFNTDLPDQ